MKYYIFTLLLFIIPFIAFSQPSWLEPYDIPATNQTFQINDCSSLEEYDFSLTQRLDTVDFIIFTIPEDSVVFDTNGECSAVHRSMTILNWLTADVYDLHLIFEIHPNQCESDIYIDMEGRKEVTVHIQDVITTGLPAEFSFSLTNPNLDTLKLSTQENHPIYTFNHQTKELCLITLHFTPCGPDFAFEIDEMIERDMTTDQCATVKVQDVLLDFNYNCGSYDLGFYENGVISSETVLSYYLENRQVDRTVMFVSQNQDTITETITFTLEATIDPNFTIIIAGDEYYNVNDTGSIEIGGEVRNMLAVAGRFYYNDITGTHISNIHPNLDDGSGAQYNFSDSSFNFIWDGPGILNPIDIPGNEPWFTFHFVANANGNISDLINLTSTNQDQIFFTGEYCDALYGQTVEYIFTDNLISSSEPLRKSSQITAFPNPASNQLQINGWKGSSADIDLFSMDGRKVLSQSYDSSLGPLSVPVHRIADGVYLLKITERNGSLADKKIVVIQH